MGKKVKLNENDLKNTLSSIKKVKPPKTVLVNNITDYWPVLNEENIVKFQEIFERYKSTNENEKSITLGLESTLRSIKNEAVKTLLISDEISPQWFGKHLISMALAKNPATKILILPKMKDVTKKLLKIPAIICGINKDIELLTEFYNKLKIHDELLKNYYHIKPNVDVSKPKKKKSHKKPEEVPEIVYLEKSSESVPIFSSTAKPEKMDLGDSLDFISLSKYDDPELLQKKIPTSSYRPLKIKKIIGNLNRKSKKS